MASFQIIAKLYHIIFLIFWMVEPVHPLTPTKELHIGAFFPMEAGSGGWPGGQACLPAIQMAFEDVNMEPDMLPNYALRLHQFNSKCQPGLAAWQLFELLYKPPTKLILLSGCSPVTTLVAEAAPVWNLLVLSYGASSPALSNRVRFPTLFRTHPSANMQNPTRVHLFEKFKWKRITILQSVEEVFDSTAKDLEEQCREKGIRVERHSFYGDPTDALKAIRRQDARIIVGLFYVTEARRVLCQAYLHGLYGRKYVWFMIGWYADTWFHPPDGEGLNCTRRQMERAAQYHFTTESIMLSRDQQPAISGMTGAQFLQRLRKRISTDPQETGGWPESPLAYDAVWALALMLNCTMHSLPPGISALEQFNYNNTLFARQMFNCMKDIRFRGVSGQVMFSDQGDRIARTQIEQMQDGKYVVLGYYDSNSQSLEWFGRQKFVGTRGPAPDSTRVKQWPITVDFRLYCVAMAVMCLGIGMIIGVWLFSRRYAARRIFIQSAPSSNRMLLLGSVLCLLSLILLGFPTAATGDGKSLLRLPQSTAWFSAFCHFRVFVLMVGFSLAYGALFAKIWVAHKLNNAQKSRQMAVASIVNEDDSTSATAPASSILVAGGTAAGAAGLHAGSGPAGTPWESIRTMLAAMVGRQAIIGTALRKISQHSSYGNLSTASGGGNKAKTPINLLILPIHPTKFYLVIFVQCFLDLFITVFWAGLDPMQRREITFPLQEPPSGMRYEDIMLMPVLEQCQSHRHDLWTVLVLGHKGVLLLFGLFLAYDTRQLKPRYISDLRLAQLAVCNVGILCLLTGPIVVLFLRAQANPFFGFVSATVLICTFVSLGLVFGPKLLFIYRWPQPTKEELQNNELEESSTVNRTEQLRYQQLLKENAELKRQIELRNIRIQECRRILQGHEKMLANSSKNRSSARGGSSKSQQQNNNGSSGDESSSTILLHNNNVKIELRNNNVISNNNNEPVSISSNVESSPIQIHTGRGGMASFLELEPTTSSTVALDPNTTMTFLEHHHGMAEEEGVDEEEQDGAVSGEQPVAERGDDVGEEQDGGGEVGGGGQDTGVCSDYEEEDEADDKVELMSTDSDDDEEEEEEGEQEILL